jgi:hypothetical protein
VRHGPQLVLGRSTESTTEACRREGQIDRAQGQAGLEVSKACGSLPCVPGKH